MHRATRFPNAVEVAIRWPSSLLLIAEMHALCITVRSFALLLLSFSPIKLCFGVLTFFGKGFDSFAAFEPEPRFRREPE